MLFPNTFPPPLTGEGEGGGGQNKDHWVPPPHHPLLEGEGKKIKRCYLVAAMPRCGLCDSTVKPDIKGNTYD
jgi:hypothetical protein